MKRFTLLLAMAMIMATSVVAWGKNGRLNIVTNSTAMYLPMYSLFPDKFVTDKMKQDMGIIVFYCTKQVKGHPICAKSEDDKCSECKRLLEEVKKFQKKWKWKNVVFVDVSKRIDKRYQCLMDRFKVGPLPDIWVIFKDRLNNTVYEQRIARGVISSDVIADAVIKFYMNVR